MKIEIFSLCDAATVGDGKLNILGSFDMIWIPSLPAVHPQCAIALKIRFEPNESGDHKIKLSLVDEQDKDVITPMGGVLNIQIKDMNTLSHNIIFNLQALKLEKEGVYSINLTIDENCHHSIPLYVRKKTSP